MTDQTNLEHKIRSLIAQWEEATRDDLTSASTHDVLNDLRDLLPPAPLPDPLFGAWATHPEHGEGIVVSHVPYRDGEVQFMFRDEDGATPDGTYIRWVDPSTLAFPTPDMSKNVAEIDTSTEHVDPIDTRHDHPVFLETEGNYRNAPEGTIVARNGFKPLMLIDERWRQTGTWVCDHEDMAPIRRRVLRWGWEV